MDFTTSDGVRIAYDDLGPRDGVPVVLCHGLGAAGEQMHADAAFLAAQGYRVLVRDVRGHGRSGKPTPMMPEGFSIERMAEDQIAMLDHAAAGPVLWVGNSLGGIVALQMLDGHEHRFRTLATYGTSYALNLPPWTAGALPLVYRVFGAPLAGRLTGKTTTRNKDAQPLIAKLITAFDPEVGRLAAGQVSRYDLIGNAVAATLPILMARGKLDRAVNSALGSTLAAMQARANFTLVELPTGGHCANLDATDELRAALLAFWGR